MHKFAAYVILSQKEMKTCITSERWLDRATSSLIELILVISWPGRIGSHQISGNWLSKTQDMQPRGNGAIGTRDWDEAHGENTLEFLDHHLSLNSCFYERFRQAYFANN